MTIVNFTCTTTLLGWLVSSGLIIVSLLLSWAVIYQSKNWQKKRNLFVLMCCGMIVSLAISGVLYLLLFSPINQLFRVCTADSVSPPPIKDTLLQKLKASGESVVVMQSEINVDSGRPYMMAYALMNQQNNSVCVHTTLACIQNLIPEDPERCSPLVPAGAILTNRLGKPVYLESNTTDRERWGIFTGSLFDVAAQDIHAAPLSIQIIGPKKSSYLMELIVAANKEPCLSLNNSNPLSPAGELNTQDGWTILGRETFVLNLS